MARLGDVCQKATSNIAQKDLEGHSGVYPIYGASGFISNIDFYQQGNPYIAVVKDGAGIGRIMKLPAKSSIIGTMQYIIPNDNVNIGYLAYAMEHMNLSKYFTGATIPHIYFKDYQAEELPLPPMEEQIKIAAVLDKVSDLIAKRRRQLDKLDLLVKARFVEMFGDPVDNSCMGQKVTLGTVADVGSSKRIFENEYVRYGVPFYRTKEIVELSKGNKISTELFITKERFDEIRREYGVPKKGDLLISAVGTIGVIWIVDGKSDFYFKDGNLLRVSVANNLNPVYLKMLLEALIVANKHKMSAGTAYSALTISTLKAMMIYIAPIDEQNKFSTFVEQTKKTKTSISHSLEKLETLKKSLMQEYFE